MRTPACGFCGLPAEPTGARPAGAPAARMDIEVPVCVECVSLGPDRPGAALRAAGRVLGVDEDDPHLHAALSEDRGAFDGLLCSDPHDPLRARRAPQTEPWGHVPRQGRLPRWCTGEPDTRARPARRACARGELGRPAPPPRPTADAFGAFLDAWRRNDPNGIWGYVSEVADSSVLSRIDDDEPTDAFPRAGEAVDGTPLYDLSGWEWVAAERPI